MAEGSRRTSAANSARSPPPLSLGLVCSCPKSSGAASIPIPSGKPFLHGARASPPSPRPAPWCRRCGPSRAAPRLPMGVARDGGACAPYGRPHRAARRRPCWRPERALASLSRWRRRHEEEGGDEVGPLRQLERERERESTRPRVRLSGSAFSVLRFRFTESAKWCGFGRRYVFTSRKRSFWNTLCVLSPRTYL
ncbi:uncharacterized protein LOC123446349 [Hordeum vulgare subsp. vulgare]|uniref:uncharacterized protein LOC123446349 n=1 Tax=Hordeum vulgare subsp. vulgare TaxID=112509 RepID=UPI001D1A3D3F|nr:uncharacterized protein LOC123446349 [Hordeum vulgare subsp. vulgare]